MEPGCIKAVVAQVQLGTSTSHHQVATNIVLKVIVPATTLGIMPQNPSSEIVLKSVLFNALSRSSSQDDASPR